MLIKEGLNYIYNLLPSFWDFEPFLNLPAHCNKTCIDCKILESINVTGSSICLGLSDWRRGFCSKSLLLCSTDATLHGGTALQKSIAMYVISGPGNV